MGRQTCRKAQVGASALRDGHFVSVRVCSREAAAAQPRRAPTGTASQRQAVDRHLVALFWEAALRGRLYLGEAALCERLYLGCMLPACEARRGLEARGWLVCVPHGRSGAKLHTLQVAGRRLAVLEGAPAMRVLARHRSSCQAAGQHVLRRGAPRRPGARCVLIMNVW